MTDSKEIAEVMPNLEAKSKKHARDSSTESSKPRKSHRHSGLKKKNYKKLTLLGKNGKKVVEHKEEEAPDVNQDTNDRNNNNVMVKVKSSFGSGGGHKRLKKVMPRHARSKDSTRRMHPGTVALREIRFYQKQTEDILPRSAFKRIMREIASDLGTDVRFKSLAVDALQAAAEDMIIKLMYNANNYAIYRGHKGIAVADVKMANVYVPKDSIVIP